MVFQVSPGVNVSEIDLTTVVPAVSTTEGAIGGVFRWGPVGKISLIDSEDNLVSQYGTPTNYNAETFFSAANFLAYGNALYVSRAANIVASRVAGANTGAWVGNAVTVDTINISAGDIITGPGIPAGSTVATAVPAGATTAITVAVPAGQSITPTGGTFVFYNPTGAFSALANSSVVSGSMAQYNVGNNDDYDNLKTSFGPSVKYIAKYPGELGNSLKISVADSAIAYQSTIDLEINLVSTNVSNIAFVVGSNKATISLIAAGGTPVNTDLQGVLDKLSVGDYIQAGNAAVGYQPMKIVAIGSPTLISGQSYSAEITFATPYGLSTNVSSKTFVRNWEYYNVVDKAPGVSYFNSKFGNGVADELHVVVVDEGGKFTGVPGSILEVYDGVSRIVDAKTEDGAGNYYGSVINNGSKYIWFGSDRSGATSGSGSNLLASTTIKPMNISFKYGADGAGESSVPFAVVAKAYDLFSSGESVDISLVIGGKSIGGSLGEQSGNYIIDNIAEKRRDCVAFLSPPANTSVVGMGATIGNQISAIKNWASTIRSSSYVVIDSGYKYQYDKYNDVYRYVPTNGDIAGLCARTDYDRDPWFSPAGFNRGQIKNIIKLAYNPSKAERDVLYKDGINPVTTFPGQGSILYGDKTHLAKPSAFDRINVRRLFIILEKAISTAAKYSLFEFNDEFTRAQFVSLVSPFLRDIQGRRGIYDFRVVCDESNNTGQVIDSNQFVGDIYVKPARSINFIQLNFVAIRTGVEFSEVVGNFG